MVTVSSTENVSFIIMSFALENQLKNSDPVCAGSSSDVNIKVFRFDNSSSPSNLVEGGAGLKLSMFTPTPTSSAF